MRSGVTEQHRADLRSSGLSESTIERSGICSATGREAAEFLGFDPGCSGWAVTYPGTEGEGGPFRRFKPDLPFDSGDGKPAKYLSPKKSAYAVGNRLYLPPNLDPGVVEDPGALLVLTEGEKKALKACQEGIPTVALSGVTCWVTKEKDGESRPIADLNGITWNQRRVVILFDSDVVAKDGVLREEYKLYRELRSRGAVCKAGRLPAPTSEENEEHHLGGKFGLDDFLVVRGSAGLKGVLQSARAPRKPPSLHRNDDGRPRHHEIARELLRDRGFVTGDGELHLRWWRSSFWRWTERAYQEWPDNDVMAAVMRYVQSRHDLGTRCTRNFVNNVVVNIQAICALDSDVAPPAWIGTREADSRHCVAVENGILDIDALMNGATDVLRPHSPRFFSMNALPFGFDPDATAPLWERTLSRILPEADTRDLLQEWFGYCLLPDVWLQKFIVMVGEGANGKSVICTTLVNLLGEDNVSAVPIERFRETHNLVGTLGKLANIVSEFEEIDRQSEGTLKAFVSGDSMEFNPKYKPTFTARPSARVVVAANNLPVLRDKSWGPYRRMVLLPFPVQIPEDEQDPHLVAKLTEELSGVLNWALVGLFRLLKRGKLAEPASSAAMREDYRRSCNPARMFIEENLRRVVTTHLPKQAVYDEYKGFCHDGGYTPMNGAHFAREVYRLWVPKMPCQAACRS